MKRVESTFELISLPDESPRPPIRSERAGLVAAMFGITSRLPTEVRPPEPYPVEPRILRGLLPRAGEVVLLVGASGAGKSSLLRALQESARRARTTWVDLATLTAPELPLVD